MEPETAPRREYDQQTSGEAVDNDQDVYLDIPDLYVESLDLQVADLRARVSLQAEVLNLLRLNVGVDAVLGEVRLDLSNVQAQALLKVRLDKVAQILDRVLTTIDSHPEMIEPLVRASVAAAERAGTAVQQALGEVGAIADQTVPEAVEDVDRLVEATARTIEPSATVRAERRRPQPEPRPARPATQHARREARQATPETRQARPEARQGRRETSESDDAAGPQQPGEHRRFPRLSRRAERR